MLFLNIFFFDNPFCLGVIFYNKLDIFNLSLFVFNSFILHAYIRMFVLNDS